MPLDIIIQSQSGLFSAIVQFNPPTQPIAYVSHTVRSVPNIKIKDNEVIVGVENVIGGCGQKFHLITDEGKDKNENTDNDNDKTIDLSILSKILIMNKNFYELSTKTKKN